MRKRSTRCLLMLGMMASRIALAEPLTHASAPRLSDGELEQLREIVAGSGEVSADEFVSCATNLMLQQYHVLPAYREVYQSAFDALIERAGAEVVAADPSTRPIVAVYEMLYRDGRWSHAMVDVAGSEEFMPEHARILLDAPWGLKDLNHPILAGVAFPEVAVRQAVWDRDHETLLFTLESQSDQAVTTTFRITSIPTNYVARLEREGRQIAAIDEHGQASGNRVVNLGPGEIQITAVVEGETRFVIRPE